MSFLLAIVRITGFVLFFMALLHVKKTRLRHLPSRRTRVSRHHGETCVWMERLANAVIEMFYVSLQEKETTTTTTMMNDEKENRGRQQTATFDAAGPRLRGQGNNARSEDSTGVKGAPRRLLDFIEERLEAMLEDRGIAANATFKVHSIGHRPPSVRAIRVTNLTGTEFTSNSPATPQAGVGSVAAGNSSMATTIPCTPGVPAATNTAGAVSAGVSNPASQKVKGRSAQLGPHASDEMGEMRSADALYEETLGGNTASLPATAVELEAEVEYSGGADFSLQADICLARGRLLPVSVRVNEVKYIKAHVRACAKLQYERATMDSRRKPYLQCTFWLESEPTFSLKMSTLFTRYYINDFFAVPLIAKFFLLRFVRHRMMLPNGAGVTVKVPLPENIVDGGTQMWCASINDVATAVSSVNGRGPSRGVG
ncbi:hypothetical protein ECC02_005603 [Trypanosoma cruzi]|uniref:Uncharacterized protein n=1 Tax=Trypanosoma cruzi TaxID=5693 RepID=A0A7J6Y3P3_TRYCR|nr:hypothetical protein ECC02_005603 [Trypanosoma cruzi]